MTMHLVADHSAGARSVDVVCCRCASRFQLSRGFADTEGRPWKDYYCSPCAMLVAPEQVLGATRDAAYRAWWHNQ